MKKHKNTVDDASHEEVVDQSKPTLSQDGQSQSQDMTQTDEAELLISDAAKVQPLSSPVTVELDDIYAKVTAKAMSLAGIDFFSPVDPGFDDTFLYNVLVLTSKCTPNEVDTFVPSQVSIGFQFLHLLIRSVPTDHHVILLPFAFQVMTQLEIYEESGHTPYPLATVKKYLQILKHQLS